METLKTVIFWISRIILSLTFIYASIGKIANPDEFYISITNYQILPISFAVLMAYLLPALELILGVGILFNRFLLSASTLIAILLFVFILAIISAWVRGLNIDCGCFNDTNAGDYINVIIRDLFLLLLTLIIYLKNLIKNPKTNI